MIPPAENPNPKKVICECGTALQRTKAQDCYNGQRVWCDLCLVHITGTDEVYHCPKGHSVVHNQGYDLCAFCADHRSVATKVTVTLRKRLEAYQKSHVELKQRNNRLQVGLKVYEKSDVEQKQKIDQLQAMNGKLVE